MTDGKTFPPEVLQQIVEKTDGVPLFVEEMTKAILESGQLTARRWALRTHRVFSTLAIPATLQDSLMARLDRLVTAKAVAQYAAVIGRQFSYALLQAVSQLDETMLQRELGRLVEAEIVYQRGVPPQATYIFKHALIQDAAYAVAPEEHAAAATTSALPRCWRPSSQRPLRHSPNCWRITTPRRARRAGGPLLASRRVNEPVERSAHVEAISHLRTRAGVAPDVAGDP